MTFDVVAAGAIFVAAYVAIATERVNRTVAALFGGMLIVVLGIISQDQAFAAVDFNVIFLLAGMMVLAEGLGQTGFFTWLAIRAVRLSGGRPFRLLVIMMLLTAVLSAFLDNVTTVVLIAPITLSVARTAGISPIPYLVSQVFASNIGGTATLIGDPPNILIGSAADLDFAAFLLNLTPVVILIMIGLTVIMWIFFGRTLTGHRDNLTTAAALQTADAIGDRSLMIRALVVMSVTMVAFVFHSAIHLEAATIAMMGATVLMLVGPLDPHRALREIEWSTLFFFVGLFILIEGVVHVGIVGTVADALAQAAGSRTDVATLVLLWSSAGLSAVVDNIPYAATAIPVVERLIDSGLNAEPLWWALALGACLGGNLTLVGASANIVVANMAQRAGHPITFRLFFLYGTVVVLMSMVISTVYVWFRYLA